MAYVISTKRGFEVRESRSTPEGPRSRTLATFKEFSDEVIEKARARAAKPPRPQDLRDAAIRAGAPVAEPPVDAAARETVRMLAAGAELDPKLQLLLLDALAPGVGTAEKPRPALSDAARSAAQWIGVGVEERGEALRDLLELADALPVRIRSGEIRFPRIESAA